MNRSGLSMRQTIEKVLAKLKTVKSFSPRAGIILGTGLGKLAKSIEKQRSISYKELPGFPVPTAAGHCDRLTWGYLSGMPVVAMEGRFHYYEGYGLSEITLPVRVMKALGIEYLVVSNAAGGLNPQYGRGDIVLIEDHINLMGVNPLIGPNDNALGPRFPDMIEPYCKKLIAVAESCALKRGIKTHRGVYVGVTGPCLETRAEYRFMRAIGADLVGMSTVPEVIVAVHAGLKVLGLSCVTDLCLPDALEPVAIEKIIKVANESEPVMCGIVMDVLKELSKRPR